MSNALFEKGREGFATGAVNWSSDDIRAILVDLNDLTQAKAITGATNATPIVITATSHGYSNGDIVSIFGVGGNTNANGVYKIKNVAANTFELTDFDDVNRAGNSAYTSGGWVMNLTTPDFLDDIAAGGRVSVSSNLANKTATNGVLDADDVTLSGVTGDPSEAIIVYKHTGVESTSRLLFFIQQATNLPVTPNGGSITIAWPSTNARICRL